MYIRTRLSRQRRVVETRAERLACRLALYAAPLPVLYTVYLWMAR